MMTGALRSNALRETQDEEGAAAEQTVPHEPESKIEDLLGRGAVNPTRQLPEAANPKLNRAAEQIGGTLGKAVHGVLRVPRSARERVHVIDNRTQEGGTSVVEQASSSASALADSFQQKARDLSDRAKNRASELMDSAEVKGRILLDKAGEIRGQAAQRAGELKQHLDERTRELQQAARLRVQQVRLEGERLVRERPLHVLAVIGVAGFIFGIALRIVRSRNASRY